VNAATFDRHLRLGLCWLDGVPTVASHAGQRQCPHCRRKWSYAVLRRRWAIAKEFCKGSTRRVAAAASGTDVHTAGRLYKQFQELLGKHFVEQLRQPEDGFYADPSRFDRAYSKVLKTPEQAKRLRLVVALCLGEMSTEARLELIYKLAFKERIQTLIRSALAARILRPKNRRAAS